MTTPHYVDRHEGGYRITGSRVSLDSIVYAFLNGESPETIAQSFPVLSLEQVYGAITYYLANRPEIDQHLKLARENAERQREQSRRADPEFYRKLAAARLNLPAST